MGILSILTKKHVYMSATVMIFALQLLAAEEDESNKYVITNCVDNTNTAV